MFGKVVIDNCRGCDCGEKHPIVNKTRYLCEKKNRERLDSQKQSKPKEKLTRVSKGLRQISSERVKEQAWYKRVCEQILEERGQVCESCGTSNYLSFSHLIPRSRRKDLITLKDNIKIQCTCRVDGSVGCHQRYEDGKIDDFNDKEHILQLVKQLDIQFYHLKFEKYDRS